MAELSGKKKLTRGEKWLLVAPLFVLLAWGWQERSTLLMRWFVRDAIVINDEVEWVQATPNGKQILIGARHENPQETSSTPFAMWDVKTREVLWRVPLTTWVRTSKFSPDGKRFFLLISLASDSLLPIQDSLEMRDSVSGQVLWTTPIAGQPNIDDATFTLDGKSIVVQNKFLEIYDATTGALQRTLPISKATYSSRFCVSHDGQMLITKKTLPMRVYGASGGLSVTTHRPLQSWLSQKSAFLYQIETWNLRNGRKLRSLPSADTKWFDVRAGRDEMVTLDKVQDRLNSSRGLTQIWNIRTGKLLRTLRGIEGIQRLDTNITQAQCLSPDGEYLFRLKLGISRDAMNNRAELVNLQTGQLMWTQSFQATPIFCRFSPDGRFIATRAEANSASGWYEVIGLWDTKTGAQLGSVIRNQTNLRFTFTGDSQNLVFFESNRVHLWDLSQYRKRILND